MAATCNTGDEGDPEQNDVNVCNILICKIRYYLRVGIGIGCNSWAPEIGEMWNSKGGFSWLEVWNPSIINCHR